MPQQNNQTLLVVILGGCAGCGCLLGIVGVGFAVAVAYFGYVLPWDDFDDGRIVAYRQDNPTSYYEDNYQQEIEEIPTTRSRDNQAQDTPIPKPTQCGFPNGDVEYWWFDATAEEQECFMDMYGGPPDIAFPQTDVPGFVAGDSTSFLIGQESDFPIIVDQNATMELTAVETVYQYWMNALHDTYGGDLRVGSPQYRQQQGNQQILIDVSFAGESYTFSFVDKSSSGDMNAYVVAGEAQSGGVIYTLEPTGAVWAIIDVEDSGM